MKITSNHFSKMKYDTAIARGSEAGIGVNFYLRFEAHFVIMGHLQTDLVAMG